MQSEEFSDSKIPEARCLAEAVKGPKEAPDKEVPLRVITLISRGGRTKIAWRSSRRAFRKAAITSQQCTLRLKMATIAMMMRNVSGRTTAAKVSSKSIPGFYLSPQTQKRALKTPLRLTLYDHLVGKSRASSGRGTTSTTLRR